MVDAASGFRGRGAKSMIYKTTSRYASTFVFRLMRTAGMLAVSYYLQIWKDFQLGGTSDFRAYTDRTLS